MMMSKIGSEMTTPQCLPIRMAIKNSHHHDNKDYTITDNHITLYLHNNVNF
jgi:hypothetical protein